MRSMLVFCWKPMPFMDGMTSRLYADFQIVISLVAYFVYMQCLFAFKVTHT